jgi:uncharacterized repeat protein (TIGR03803 family)
MKIPMKSLLIVELWVILMAWPASAQTITTLALFDGFNGAGPYTAPLVQGTDGNFYGTTAYGGANCFPSGCGTIFKVTPQGAITTLYSFCTQEYCADGSYPYARLVLAPDGNFYGTTTQGGTDFHGGTVFKINPSGTLTTLYNFCSQTNCTDGSYPSGGLLQATDGNFYGTTFMGGVGDAQYCNGGCGTVFKISTKGVFTSIHNFTGFAAEGSGPSAALIQARNGNFYGTTTNGGAYNTCNLACGTVFEITPTGTLTTLHSFAGYPSDGSAPYGSLVLGPDDTFWGSTSGGGSGDYGTIFKITASGTLSIVYNFCSLANCADGGQPESGLVFAGGNLYGNAVRGGLYAVGSIFKITPQTGAFSTLYSFCSQGYPACPDGSFAYAGLLQATDGSFYSSMFQGGDTSCSCGTVFDFALGLKPFVEALPGSGKTGAKVQILGTNLSTATAVSFNGAAAQFAVKLSSLIVADVPQGATSGYVTVTTATGILKSNAAFNVTH